MSGFDGSELYRDTATLAAPEKSAAAFANSGRDTTHHSAYGAYELARAVVQGIQDAKLIMALP